MTGIIAQIVALISHGNHYFNGGSLGPEFIAKNTAFQFCDRVIFRTPQKPSWLFRTRTELVATNPTAWFRSLRESSAKHLRLRYLHTAEEQTRDYMMAGFVGGGGHWLIEAQMESDRCVAWRNQWEVIDADQPENRIWSVSYFSDGVERETTESGGSPEASRQRLETALKEIIEFAIANDLGWVDHFEKGISALSSSSPEVDFSHQDLLVREMYTLEQRQLFYSAGLAWCFGGMGWWNDVYLEPGELQDRHERVSAELFDAINQALETVLS